MLTQNERNNVESIFKKHDRQKKTIRSLKNEYWEKVKMEKEKNK